MIVSRWELEYMNKRWDIAYYGYLASGSVPFGIKGVLFVTCLLLLPMPS